MDARKLIRVLNWFRKGKPNESGGHLETDRISKLDSETSKLPKRSPAPDLSPDDIARIGPYRVVNRLGEGGMGRVYRVLFERADSTEPQYYALKALTYTEEEADKGQLERFKREIVIGITIRHPNVCRVVDWGFHDDNTPYIVMELLEGEPLAEHIKRYAPLSADEARAIVLQILQGLEAIHAVGVIHRDLKPQNIFLAKDGLVKIMDFGIARKQGYRTITTTGMSFATPSFISPEQLTDAKTVDRRTDLFNTGMILYHMLTRKMPFDAPTLSQTVRNVIAGTPPPLAQIRQDLPPGLEPWMLRLMARDRDQRFPTAREAIDALNF